MKLNPIELFKPTFLKQYNESYIEGGASYFVVDDDTVVFLVSTMMTPGEYKSVFNSISQIESIFNAPLNRLTAFDVMYFIEAHRGSEYQCDFTAQHPTYTKLPGSQQPAYLNRIISGTFDFRDFIVEAGFDLEKYVNVNFPKFKPTF